MKLRRFSDADEFLADAGEFLARREAEHNLLLGLAGRLRTEPALFGHEPYFAVVTGAGRVVGAALRTPPHNAVLSELDDPAAVDLIAADLLELDSALPGVLGPKTAAARFVSVWEQLGGATGRLAMAERIYRADRAHAPTGVPGRMRAYVPADRETAVAWLLEFAAESMGTTGPPLDAEDWLDRRVREPEGGVAIWADTSPVSLAGFGNPTPTGIRVGPVYTPPALRRRGYATALVAGLTDMLLRRGLRFCFLFTDLANPTSNAIYQRIGYRPITDVDMWAFEAWGETCGFPPRAPLPWQSARRGSGLASRPGKPGSGHETELSVRHPEPHTSRARLPPGLSARRSASGCL